MRRRAFLKAGAVAAAGLPLASPALAQSAPELRWRLTSSFPRTLDTIFGAAELLARHVSEATDRRFQIEVFGAGELVPGLQALDAVSNGSIHCAQTPTYFYTGKEPALAFGTGIPFGLNQRHQHSWWHFGGGAEIINEALQRFNAHAIVMGSSGTQMGGWFRKEIRTVDDLKGLRFRIGGPGGQVLARLGVLPQPTPLVEVAAALERGALDAAEFVGPYDDERLGLNRVARYYYYPGWWEGGAMLHLVINREHWQALPKRYQVVLQQAGESANAWMLARYDRDNPAALKRLIAGGTELRAFPPAVIEACRKAADELSAEFAERSPLFRKALDSHDAFQRDALSYWRIAEHAFDTMMIGTVR
jgi:TRAP-type mannitol/chloroaromatic compound transport system substrate-binding protein